LAPDTVVVIAARDGYDLLQAVAAGGVVALCLGVLLIIAYTMAQVARTVRAIRRARDAFSSDPAMEAIRKTAKNVESISQALHTEVAKLSESVSGLSDRLTQASDRMEERIEEFNAFMEVVQGEAEGVFVESAARARGVRTGLGNLTGSAGPRKGAKKSPGEVAVEPEEGESARPIGGQPPDDVEGSGPSVGHERGG